MPDAQSLPVMLNTHEQLFGEGFLQSVATDKEYYWLTNEQILIHMGVTDSHLPRPDRILSAAPATTSWPIRRFLHNLRAGIELLIGRTKQGGQMRRSRNLHVNHKNPSKICLIALYDRCLANDRPIRI